MLITVLFAIVPLLLRFIIKMREVIYTCSFASSKLTMPSIAYIAMCLKSIRDLYGMSATVACV